MEPGYIDQQEPSHSFVLGAACCGIGDRPRGRDGLRQEVFARWGQGSDLSGRRYLATCPDVCIRL